MYSSCQSFFMRRAVCSRVFLIFFSTFGAIMGPSSTNRFKTSHSVSVILASGCSSVCSIVSLLSSLGTCWIFSLRFFIRLWKVSCVFVKFWTSLCTSIIRVVSSLSDAEEVCTSLVKLTSFLSNICNFNVSWVVLVCAVFTPKTLCTRSSPFPSFNL